MIIFGQAAVPLYENEKLRRHPTLVAETPFSQFLYPRCKTRYLSSIHQSSDNKHLAKLGRLVLLNPRQPHSPLVQTIAIFHVERSLCTWSERER